MLSAISSTTSLAASQYIQASQPPAGQTTLRLPAQDTVQLSPAAQRAIVGDVDHDGDSH